MMLRGHLASLAFSGAWFLQAQTGALDPDFNFDGAGADGEVLSVVAHPEGGYLITGFFQHYNGTPRPGIAKLDADGTLDQGFEPAVAEVFPRARPAVLPDCRVYMAVPGPGIVRLLPHGAVDTSFQVTDCNATTILSFAPRPDGRVVVGGSFHQPFRRIMRITGEGALDPVFDPGEGVQGLTGWISSIAVQPDGRLIVAGGLSGFDGATHSGILRLLPDGAVDTTFIGTGVESLGYGAEVRAVALQADGRILIGGGFATVNGQSSRSIARLLPDGTLDPSFQPGTGFDAPGNPNDPFRSYVHAMALQPDGRILVGGNFDSYDGQPCHHLARLMPDGSFDASFVTGTGCDAPVNTLALVGGMVVAGGGFASYDGEPRAYIMRLRAMECTSLSLMDSGALASCGLEEVQLDGTTTLHAEPWPDADEYAFTFIDHDSAAAAPVTLFSAQPLLVLDAQVGGWLQPGRTYIVRVQAFADGIAVTCVGDSSCTLALAPVSGLSVAPGPVHDADLRAWPVPATGEVLQLQWASTAGAVDLNVIDPSGRSVHRERLVAGGSEHVLHLDRAWANGPYVLHLRTAGGVVTRRVVLQR